MKKVGIITSTLTSGHSVRGIGFYTRGLLSEIHKYAKDFDLEIEEIAESSSKLSLIHYPFFDLFDHTLPINRSVKTVVTVHDVIPLQFPQHYPPGIKGNLNFRLQQIALNSVSAVITDSFASVNEIRRHLGVPHSKINLVYLASAPNIHKVTAKNKKYILCVNDVNYNKNIVNLIKASQTLKVPLVLVGKQAAEIEKLDLNHPELAHLKEIISYLDSPLLIRPGFVTDAELSKYYSEAAVYCHPSFAEGFGIGVANALECGCPVVCSHVSSLPEIAGDAAIYVDPYSLEDLTSALSQVLTNATLRSKLTKLGAAQIQKFSWKNTAIQTLQVYNRILSP